MKAPCKRRHGGANRMSKQYQENGNVVVEREKETVKGNKYAQSRIQYMCNKMTVTK